MLIILQLFSGFVWSGFNLATFNFIFDAVRRENVSKIMSYFNTLNTFCAFLGTITGGFLIDLLSKSHFQFLIFNSFTLVFVISGCLRITVLLIFIKKFKEVREAEPAPAFHYFYIYKPVSDIADLFQDINKRVLKQGRLLKGQEKKIL